MTKVLKYVSEKVVEQLFDTIGTNLENYNVGSFESNRVAQGWGLELKRVTYDPSFPSNFRLDNSREAEIENSLLVYSAFQGMTPALAREERIWVRLCHLEYLGSGLIASR